MIRPSLLVSFCLLGILGKHQNPWRECRIKEMQRDGVNLARRKSGGGAVYQDLGNTCFSFLDPLDNSIKSNQYNGTCRFQGNEL
jgi:lipoate-protein ligase A